MLGLALPTTVEPPPPDDGNEEHSYAKKDPDQALEPPGTSPAWVKASPFLASHLVPQKGQFKPFGPSNSSERKKRESKSGAWVLRFFRDERIRRHS